MGLRSRATKAATSPNRGKHTMGMHNARKHGIAAVSLIAGGIFASASTARADGPGIGALTYTSTEVSGTAPVKVVYPACKDYPTAGSSSPRNNSYVMMHRGYLFSVVAIDSGKVGGGFEVYDFSNPRNPTVLYRKCDSSTNPLREMHAYGVWRNDVDGKEYIALPSTKGIQIWNITNPLAPTLTNDMSLTGITSSDYADGTWWTSWVGHYIYVGGSSNGMYTIDASDPANAKLYDPYNKCWNGVSGCVGAPLQSVDIGDFRTNIVQVVGNIMMVAGADTALGVALFDLSDPLQPVLRYKNPSPVSTYNYMLAGKWNDPSTLIMFQATGSATGSRVSQVSNDLKTLTQLYDN